MYPIPSLGPLKTKRLIGRTKEKEALKAAIEAEGELRVIHIIGGGGIGKTRLLEAVPDEMLPTCSNKAHCQWCEIFDLYHTDIHTNSGIEAAILEALDPDGNGFKKYREKRAEYEKLRRAGGYMKLLEELREELGRLFVKEFNEITAQTRPLLCFDTVELIQYESDVVQEVCGIEYGGVEVREWLKTVIPQLENTVVIFAGRPKPQLWEDLQTNFIKPLGELLRLQELSEANLGQVKESRHIEARLGGLSAQEAAEYFEDLAEQNPRITQAALTAGDTKYIHQVTEGYPLRIAFVSTLVANGARLPRETLEEIERKPETVDERLIDEIQQLTTDMAVVLPFMGWTRKGMDSELLHRIVTAHFVGLGWNMNQCEQMLDFLRTLPFVKVRPDSPLVFLHDEMYDLLDQHVLRHRPGDQGEVAQITGAYYEERIENLKGKEKAAKELEEKTQARREWQRLAVERLYYQLLTNPARGFNEYRRLSDEAIIAHEVGFDMSLRDEMLHFFSQRGPQAAQEQITRDSAVRWVKRFLAMGYHEQAREVAKRIWAHNEPPFQRTDADPYFTAALQLYRGEALVYLGEEKKAINLLQDAIELLEPAEPKDTYQERNRAHMLGRAHNVKGYANVRLKDCDKAIVEYSTALRYLKRTGFWGGVADTEKNLAYAYAMVGRWTDAVNLCEESLRRFRELGIRWGEAMTLNVYGLVEVENDHPHRARKRCRDALQILVDLGDQRGIGLTSIALGRALRKLGSQPTYLYSTEADDMLQGAEGRLQTALIIFPSIVDEPVREIEAVGELGRIYREWAYVYRQRGEESDPRVEKWEKRAEDNLHKAAERASAREMLTEEADVYADLAALYFNRKQYDVALEWATKSEERLPKGCMLSIGQGLPAEKCPLSEYWLILGKNSLLRGDMAFANGLELEEANQVEEATAHYRAAVEYWTRAFGYLEAYSPTHAALALTRDRVYRKLIALVPDTLRALQGHCHQVEKEYGLKETILHRIFPDLIEAAVLYQ